ncbi:hypothetical protein DFH09DRAFT_1091811 [Mycena vulgaris]|nr:hypothetical protein DFH09DRAFT_1091811 [Mycena vulgaris]
MFAKALLTIALSSLAVGQFYAAAASVVRSGGSGNICPNCVNPKIVDVRSAALEASVPWPVLTEPEICVPTASTAAPEDSAPEEGVAARNDGSGNICPNCVNPKVTEARSVALEDSVLVDVRGASNRLIGIGRHRVSVASIAEVKDPNGIHQPTVRSIRHIGSHRISVDHPSKRSEV